MTLLEPKYVGQIGKDVITEIPPPFRYYEMGTVAGDFTTDVGLSMDLSDGWASGEGAKKAWFLLSATVEALDTLDLYLLWSYNATLWTPLVDEAGAAIKFAEALVPATYASIIGNRKVSSVGAKGIPIAAPFLKVGVDDIGAIDAAAFIIGLIVQ